MLRHSIIPRRLPGASRTTTKPPCGRSLRALYAALALLLLLQPSLSPAGGFGTTIEVTAPGEPLPILLLTREEIARLPAEDLHHLLALFFPGAIARRAPFGAQADARIKSFGFEDLRVWVDDTRADDPQTGHFHLAQPVPLEEIDRLVVTADGTVRITTRRDTGLDLGLSAGAFGLFSGSAAWGGRWRGAEARVAVDSMGHDGWRYDTELKRTSFRFSGTAGPLRFHWARGSMDYGAYNFYTTLFPNQKERLDQILGDITVRAGSVDMTIYGRELRDDFLLDRNDPPLYHSEHRNRRIGVRAAGNGSSAWRWTLDAFRDSIASRTLGNHARWRAGIELHRDVRTMRLGLTVEGGDGGWTVLPSLGWKRGSWYAGLSGGRRLPSFTELYYRSPANLGDQDLDPPEHLLLQGGYRSGGWDASLWTRRFHRAIDWRERADGVFEAAALPDFSIHGADIRLSTPPVMLFFSGQILDAPFETANLKYARDYPAIQAGLIYSLRGEGWEATLTGRRVVPLDADPYTTADGRLSIRIADLTLLIDGYNLLNSHYEERTGIPMPGRWIRMGVRFSLGSREEREGSPRNDE